MMERYLIALKTITVEEGVTYAAGARIYRVTDSGKALVKVASHYLAEETKSKATMLAIKELLDDVQESSVVSFLGMYLGKSRDRTLKKAFISSIVASKGLTVNMYNNALKENRNELYELATDAVQRQASVIANI
jgi:hypothetical protein